MNHTYERCPKDAEKRTPEHLEAVANSHDILDVEDAGV
jgi:hypothetical protein